jgi:hypothetical protein
VNTVVVDGNDKTTFINAVQAIDKRMFEVLKRAAFAKGCVLLPKRWRVEQIIDALTISYRLKNQCKNLGAFPVTHGEQPRVTWSGAVLLQWQRSRRR